jgi:hypothetical protein
MKRYRGTIIYNKCVGQYLVESYTKGPETNYKYMIYKGNY